MKKAYKELKHETKIHKKLNKNKVPNILQLYNDKELKGRDKLDFLHQRKEFDIFKFNKDEFNINN